MYFFHKKKESPKYGKIIAITLAAVAGACAVAFFIYKLVLKLKDRQCECDELDLCEDCPLSDECESCPLTEECEEEVVVETAEEAAEEAPVEEAPAEA